MSCFSQEFRCHDCHKLLFKGLLIEGELEVKCKSCHVVNVITKSEGSELLCMIPKCPNRVFAPGVKKS